VADWEFVHVAIDDHSRLAYAEVLADERGETAVGFLRRALRALLREWACVRLYGTSAERIDALPLWLDRYNWRRPHDSLGHRPPGSRLTNVAGSYI
jgi:Integrase core domain